MINYVTTKTPLRVSFVGGGTDFYKHYRVHGGSVVSTAINKYIYVTVKRHSDLFNEKYRLNYSDTEIAQGTKYIKNEITKACLEYMKINFSVYISTISDMSQRLKPQNQTYEFDLRIYVHLGQRLPIGKMGTINFHQ